MPVRPYKYLTLVTKLPLSEVEKRLKEQVETDPDAYRSSSLMFMGEVTAKDFEIYRRITYNNSFLPLIDGSLTELADGTEIDMVMRLAPPVLRFVVLWILLTGGLGIYLVWRLNSLTAVQPFGMLAFMYLLTTIAFSVESTKATDALKIILDAEEG